MSSLWSGNSPVLIIGAASLWTIVITCLCPGSQLTHAAQQACHGWRGEAPGPQMPTLEGRAAISLPGLASCPFYSGLSSWASQESQGASGQLSWASLLPAAHRACGMREPNLLATPGSVSHPSELPGCLLPLPSHCPGSQLSRSHCHRHPLVPGRNGVVNK